jgi:ATP-dependent RNA helicase RhlE
VPEGKDKIDVLHDILIGEDCKLALVFRRTTHRTDKLARDLERRGFRVAALHGRRTQSQRERALDALRGGRLQVLVATDIAARGLDIAGLTHVVNFDLPDTADNYTHRVGRTARMGADGMAITLVGPEDEEALRAIQRKMPSSQDRTAQSAHGHRTPAAQADHARPHHNRGRQPAHGAPRQGPNREPGAVSQQHAPMDERPGAGDRRPAAPARTRRPRGAPYERRATGGGTVVADTGDGVWYPFHLPDRAPEQRSLQVNARSGR